MDRRYKNHPRKRTYKIQESERTMLILTVLFFITTVLLLSEHIKLVANIERLRILRGEDPKGILEIKLRDLVKLYLIKKWR